MHKKNLVFFITIIPALHYAMIPPKKQLMIAVKNKNLEKITQLSIHPQITKDDLTAAFLYAASINEFSVATILIDYGAQINATYIYGKGTALHAAARYG